MKHKGGDERKDIYRIRAETCYSR